MSQIGFTPFVRLSSRSKVGRYLKQLREKRKWTQERLANFLKINKSQVAHIEKGVRKITPDLLNKITNKDCFQPPLTLKELEELKLALYEEFFEAAMPNELKFLPQILAPVLGEVRHQSNFKEVYVVAVEPIELLEINDSNVFLLDLVEQLKNTSKENIDRKYVYWTVELSLPKFRTFFDFLEHKGVKPEIIDKVFEFIIAPLELCLLSFAIYSFPQELENNEYKQVGRILIRNGDTLEFFDAVKMGSADLSKIYKFLKNIYDELSICTERGKYKKASVTYIKEQKTNHL